MYRINVYNPRTGEVSPVMFYGTEVVFVGPIDKTVEYRDQLAAEFPRCDYWIVPPAGVPSIDWEHHQAMLRTQLDWDQPGAEAEITGIIATSNDIMVELAGEHGVAYWTTMAFCSH